MVDGGKGRGRSRSLCMFFCESGYEELRSSEME